MNLLLIAQKTPELNIRINFDEFFEVEDIGKETCIFNIKKKRSYTNIADEQILMINRMINELEPEYYMHQLLAYKLELLKGKGKRKKPWDLEKIFKKYVRNETLDYISKVVETEYQINIENEENYSNEQIQMNNAQAKAFIKVSFAIRTYALIVLDLLHEAIEHEKTLNIKKGSLDDVNSVERNSDLVLFNCFKYFLAYFQPEEIGGNLERKLRKVVESRVKATEYSDGVMWNFLKNMTSDISIVAENFTVEMVTSILAKADIAKNFAVFVHSVLNNKIENFFRSNFTITMIATNTQITEEDSYHKIDHKLQRSNEGKKIISDFAIERVKVQYNITDEELNSFMRAHNNCINKQQMKLVEIFAEVHIKIKLISMNYVQYTILRIAMIKFLVQHNLLMLAQRMAYAVDSENSKESLIKHSVLINLKIYQSILEKYKAINHKIHENKLIYNIVDTIVSAAYTPVELNEETTLSFKGITADINEKEKNSSMVLAELMLFINLTA